MSKTKKRSAPVLLLMSWFLLSYSACIHKSQVVYDPTTEAYITKPALDSLPYVFDKTVNDTYVYFIQYLKCQKVNDSTRLYQGDIELTSNLNKATLLDTIIPNRLDTLPTLIAVAPASQQLLWPRHTVRYRISSLGATSNFKTAIMAAISEWESAGITFKNITDDSGDYILFESLDSYEYNASALGRQGKKQLIKIAKGATVGNIIHEIGHALGLWHEHSRPDREQHVHIIEKNLEPGHSEDFQIINEGFSYYNTPYDYESIMHYGASAFARKAADGSLLITIQPTKAGAQIGQRSRLSEIDKRGIKSLYNL